MRAKRKCGKYDLTGQRFGKLVVIERAFVRKKKVYWKCQCDCGEVRYHFTDTLLRGNAKSCGCGYRKHELSHSGLWNVFYGMRKRCLNPLAHGYENYGGRGIKVCDEWLEKDGFIKFKEWALANGYEKGLSLDRIDNNGNYEPSNCRWATDREQANNRRNNVLVTYKGETHTISEWAKKTGLKESCIRYRFHHGWKEEDLFKPVQH